MKSQLEYEVTDYAKPNYEIKGSKDISTQMKLRQATHPDDIADLRISFCNESPARA